MLVTKYRKKYIYGELQKFLYETINDDQEKKEGANQMCEILDEVKEEGKNEGKIELLVDLVKTGVLSISEAAKKIKMSEEEFKKYL